ncbi:hypothetical protein NHJ13734_009912 [Beauveria thailandica]
MLDLYIRPRVLTLCFLAALSTSVAGQWTGSFNTTAVPDVDPPERCWVRGFSGDRNFPGRGRCACTSGRVYPDCNYFLGKQIWNRVSEAVCTCPTDEFQVPQDDSYKECICDADLKKDVGSGFPLGPGCWCPAKELATKDGLTDATSQASQDPPSPDVQGNNPVDTTPAAPKDNTTCPE